MWCNINSSLGEGNSPLELHSADLADFGRSQTPSLASRPKFAKNYESQTENPSVVLKADSIESSLRGRIVDSHEAIQKIAQPNLTRFVYSAQDSQSIRATNRNRSNGGSALRYFGAK